MELGKRGALGLLPVNIIEGAAAVPEPASAVLLGTALAGLLLAGAIRRIRPEA